MTALICPEGCEATRPHIGSMMAHLVEDHLISASVVHERASTARRVPVPGAPTSLTDPLGLDRNAIKKYVEPGPISQPIVPRATNPASGNRPVTPAVTPPAIEEPTMEDKDCRGCGAKFTPGGPKAAFCKKCRANKCTTCKRMGGTHTDTCVRVHGKRATRAASKPRAGGGTRRKKTAPPAEPAVSGNGHALSDNDAKKTGEQLLGQLLRIRDNLDTKITSVRELIAIL